VEEHLAEQVLRVGHALTTEVAEDRWGEATVRVARVPEGAIRRLDRAHVADTS
jgi:hypothetical protein